MDPADAEDFLGALSAEMIPPGRRGCFSAILASSGSVSCDL